MDALEGLLEIALAAEPRAPLLRQLLDLAATGGLERNAIRQLVPEGQRAPTQDAYLTCVAAALADHALTPEELSALRMLRTALGIQDRELIVERRIDAQRISADVMRSILIDRVVDEEEEGYQVALQEALAVSYDDFAELSEEPLREVLTAALGELDPLGLGLTDEGYRKFELQALRLRNFLKLDLRSGSPGDWGRQIPPHLKDAVWRRDGGRCVRCESQEHLQFAHIIPLGKGGANTYRNIELLCAICGRAKSDQIG